MKRLMFKVNQKGPGATEAECSAAASHARFAPQTAAITHDKHVSMSTNRVHLTLPH